MQTSSKLFGGSMWGYVNGSTIRYCHERFNLLMKDIKEPKVTISQNDVYFPERPSNDLSYI